MTTRGQRVLLRAALVEIADPQGPPDGAPAVRAVIRTGLDHHLIDAAVAHGLIPPLISALEDAGWAGDTSRLRREVDEQRLRRLRGISTVVSFGQALEDAGHRWAALKGPVVASFLPHPEWRSFNDVDLLVPGRDLEAVIDTLVAAGAEEINRNWQGYLEHGSGEVPIRAPLISIDLHWHLVGMARMRRFFTIDIDGMLDRRRRVPLGDSEVAALSPEDQLIHVALHSAFAGGARLDQLRDVCGLAANDTIDWGVVVERARRYRAARMVGHTLDRAAEVLAAPVPAEVTAELAGWVRHVRRRIDRSGPRRIGGRKGYVRWLIQGHRDEVLTTVRVTARLMQMNLATRLGRPPRFDAGDVGGPLYYATEAGGTEARARYLAYAASRG